MKTVTIQIGNTDNKLSQKEWSEFIEQVEKKVNIVASVVHFSGGSTFDKPWQNACWVFECYHEDKIIPFKREIAIIGYLYKQDSIAITIGETKLLECKE